MACGNADTLQQRARFFGYAKLKGYFGVCRVYLEQALKDAFTEYVEHEQIMRAELGKIRRDRRKPANLAQAADTGSQPSALPELRYPRPVDARFRTGRLDPSIRRADDTRGEGREQKGRLRSSWPNAKFHNDSTYAPISVAQTHEVAEAVPITQLIEMLLEYKCEDARDTANIAGLLITLGAALDIDRKATAAVYRMRPGATSRRDIDKRWHHRQLPAGPHGARRRRLSYPGDGFFKSDSKLTLQLHSFDLTIDKKPAASAAPLIIWHVPAPLAKAWLVQLQAGQPRP